MQTMLTVPAVCPLSTTHTARPWADIGPWQFEMQAQLALEKSVPIVAIRLPSPLSVIDVLF